MKNNKYRHTGHWAQGWLAKGAKKRVEKLPEVALEHKWGKHELEHVLHDSHDVDKNKVINEVEVENCN